MSTRKCYCGVCEADHEMEMDDEEFAMMVRVSPRSLLESGRLQIACDDCRPFRYSVKGKNDDL